jgi:hypothetical protein
MIKEDRNNKIKKLANEAREFRFKNLASYFHENKLILAGNDYKSDTQVEDWIQKISRNYYLQYKNKLKNKMYTQKAKIIIFKFFINGKRKFGSNCSYFHIQRNELSKIFKTTIRNSSSERVAKKPIERKRSRD